MVKTDYTMGEPIARDPWHNKTVRGPVSSDLVLRGGVFLYPFLACPQFAQDPGQCARGDRAGFRK